MSVLAIIVRTLAVVARLVSLLLTGWLICLLVGGIWYEWRVSRGNRDPRWGKRG